MAISDEAALQRDLRSVRLAQDLQGLVNRLSGDLAERSPGVTTSVALHTRGAAANLNSAFVTESASLAKAYWVVAAVASAGIEAVAPHAEPIFLWSDNDAAGRVIDLVGVDAINAFTGNVGMRDTFLAIWVSEGVARVASDRGVQGRPSSNQTTTADALVFLRMLYAGDLLDPGETAAVLEWMTVTNDFGDGSRVGLGSVLADSLGSELASEVMHKSGWLPPGCCGTRGSLVIAMGVVPLQGTAPLFIAVSASGGSDYAADTEWLSEAVSGAVSLAQEAAQQG